MSRTIAATVLPAGALCALALSACGTNVFNQADMEKQLRTQLSKSAGVSPVGIKVSCPADQEVKKGHKFSCTLTASDGTKAKVFVTATNDSGHYTATVPQ